VGETVLNEIHYHPADAELEVEFIEVAHRGAAPRALFDAALGRGWRIAGVRGSDGAPFEFGAGTAVPPAGYLLVVAGDPARFRDRLGVPPEVPVVGPFAGALDNGGEVITLEEPLRDGAAVVHVTRDRVHYDDRAPWPEPADGDGASLERIDGAAHGNEAANWGASALHGGTPGARNTIAVEPQPSGAGLPGDIDSSGGINLNDAIVLLRYLHQGGVDLPCGSGAGAEAGNRALLDANGDAALDATDAVYLLRYVFLGGPEHVLGTECVPVIECAQSCPR
jgi:hypothetical protein